VKNTNIAIPIVVGIIIVIVGVIALTNQESNVMEVEDVFDKELKPNEEIIPKIQEKLDEIEKTNLENKYEQKPREWMTSGPFQIDRSEYVLGEKIFDNCGWKYLLNASPSVPSNDIVWYTDWCVSFNGLRNAICPFSS